ncbi:XrtA-associated tyrosine autokinase [Methylomarinovum caldicuralii]|uniref:XrtA-associated tyrosine autokinase n=1 Tax=Methylomarinovum caldicuralii TaxID=438856 RepID=UPI002955DCD9|nr:XrtA-associated tyrosine autokinase [Methylomarinovum caldicuralii]
MSIIEKALEKQGGLPPEPAAFEAATDGPASEPAKPSPQVSKKPQIIVNRERLQERGMLAPDAASGQLVEEYRMIKRPLLMNAFGEGAEVIPHANLILVTSSLPGEGKTFTAVNLALSIAAERDKTVLLVDADVIKPATSRLFDAHERPGLIDVLEREKPLADVLLRTDIPKLTLLPAGRQHSHATELLASEEMQRLAREISQRYPDRVVIFDSPPLLATTQASVLATHVGQVVLVVEAESTPQYIVKEAADMLNTCEVVGCVLNKTQQGFGLGYYAYYGYKYYNYGE